MWLKPDPKVSILHDILENVNSRNRPVFARGWGWGEVFTTKGLKETFRGD